MRWLGHTGLGGDRNIGKGKFKFHISDFQLPQPGEANALVTLSLFHPSRDTHELDKFKGSSFFNYILEERRGYFGAPRPGMYIKPPVMMFKEGSVFPTIPGQGKFGTLVRMTGKNGQDIGGHPVYHNGIGFMVKMKIRNK
jgi:CRISPR type III-A-associated RAMP protein Csm4